MLSTDRLCDTGSVAVVRVIDMEIGWLGHLSRVHKTLRRSKIAHIWPPTFSNASAWNKILVFKNVTGLFPKGQVDNKS